MCTGEMDNDGIALLLRPHRRIEREPHVVGGAKVLLQPVGDAEDDPPNRAVGIDRSDGDRAGGGCGRALFECSEGSRNRRHRTGKRQRTGDDRACQDPSCCLHAPSHHNQSIRGMSSVGVVIAV